MRHHLPHFSLFPPTSWNSKQKPGSTSPSPQVNYTLILQTFTGMSGVCHVVVTGTLRWVYISALMDYLNLLPRKQSSLFDVFLF